MEALNALVALLSKLGELPFLHQAGSVFVKLMLALVAGLLASLVLGAAFLQDFYGVPSFSEALRHMMALFFSRLHESLGTYSGSTAVIMGGKEDDPGKAIYKVGGPGYIAILYDSAAVLERAGRLTRILGPCYKRLQPFEVVKGAVDLRPQVKRVLARALTSDGIPVQAGIEVEFQLWQLSRQKGTLPGQRGAGERHSSPYFTASWWAVRNAIYNPPVMGGEQLPLGELVATDVEYYFQRLIARRTFNELFEPPLDIAAEPLPYYMRPRRQLEFELASDLRIPLRRWGCQLNRLHIGPIEPDSRYEEASRIINRRLARWRASEMPQLRAIQAQGKARALQIRSLARAQVEVQILERIAEALRETAPPTGGAPDLRYTVVALAFLTSLENILSQSQEVGLFLVPMWVINCLRSLKKILER